MSNQRTHQTAIEHWQDHLEAKLAGDGIEATRVRVYQQTASTQDVAKSFAPARALVIADQQTAGRGRLGRAWLSSPGASVLMSLTWPIESTAYSHDRVSMLAGLAVAQAVESLLPGVPVRLKWPNDLMVDGRKLAGILIDVADRVCVIGIGLNVLPGSYPDEAVRQRSVCLADLGEPVDRLRVIESIVAKLNETLGSTERDALLDAWRSRAALGQTQTFEHNGQQITGEVIDLDPDHGLIIRRDSGEIVTLPAATTSVVA